MQTVTDRISNPFGLVVPEQYADPESYPAVYGYGDANADFHVIGDRPSVHGGASTGIPFTDSVAGRRLQRVLRDTGFLAGDGHEMETPVGDATEPDSASPDAVDTSKSVTMDGGSAVSGPVDTAASRSNRESGRAGTLSAEAAEQSAEDRAVALRPRNLYMSYRFAGTRPTEPDERAYGDLERYFDAELRAINAHVLLPVGPNAIDHVLEAYTTKRRKYPDEIDDATMHATEIRGRGFLVVPIREPSEWTEGDESVLVDRLNAIRGRDYRQTKGVATRVG